MTAYPTWAEDLGHGVHAIDTGFHRPRFDAAYLVVEDGRAAFIDTGPNAAVPRLLALLDVLGLPRSAVDHVIPTHVHLDHAGGVGALMQALPAATLWVHPRGLRHMLDPSRLYAGALDVYGQAEMDRSYGQLLPVPAERARGTDDDGVITLGGRALRVAHTPGHARHHHCLWDPHTRGWFTGDTFGLSYREFDTAAGAWILPTSTPVQFEPEPLKASLRRLLAADPACMYLTHYGRVTDVQRLGRLLLSQIDAMVAFASRIPPGPSRHAQLCAEMKELAWQGLQAQGHPADKEEVAALLAMDIELNAQGLAIWLDRLDRPGSSS
jgi:glyoxylase-like metal-dependent hydrolase (beta-lactamase superfamily II)